MHGIIDLKGTAFCVHKFVEDSEFEISPVCADTKFVLVYKREHTSTHNPASLHRYSH